MSRVDDYLTAVLQQANSTLDVEKMAEMMHPEAERLLGPETSMNNVLHAPYETYIGVDGDAEAWRSQIWPEIVPMSNKVRYSYLKHQELSLQRLISKTLPKQLLLLEEVLDTTNQQVSSASKLQETQLEQLSAYRDSIKRDSEPALQELRDQWASAINENLERLLR